MAPGQTAPVSEEAIQMFQTVLSRHPDHPYANHLLIHALEGTDQFRKSGGGC